MQITLFTNINQGINNLHYSEDRLNYIIDINLEISKLMLVTASKKQRKINPNLPIKSYPLFKQDSELNDMFSKSVATLKQAATNLKNAQNDLSSITEGMSQSSLEKINPDNVLLNYKPVANMPLGYSYTIMQALMEIVISSFRIATMRTDQVDDETDATVYFVTKNSLNGILTSLDSSANAIVSETSSSKDSNVFVFLILLLVASIALVISTGILIPVIRNVKSNKQDVLELFMHVTKISIDEELRKCKKFLGSFQINQETELILEGENNPDNNLGENEKASVHDGKIKKGYERTHISGGRRIDKFKRLSLGIAMLTFKFLFVILLMEAFFIITYFLSYTFLDRVSSLTKEINQLISRLPQHGLILLTVK